MEFFKRAYKNYANFQGRDTREQYWMFYLFYMIIIIVLSVIDELIGTDGLFSSLFLLASIIPSIAITTRRLHDIGKSGWWQLILLVPIIGAIVIIVFLAKKGMIGDNQFGVDPQAQVSTIVENGAENV